MNHGSTHEDDQRIAERLQALFAAQARAVESDERSWSDVVDVGRPPRARHVPVRVLLAAAAALAVTLAVTVEVSEDRTVDATDLAGPATGAAVPPPTFEASTKQVTMTAGSIAIEVGGKTFRTAGPLEVRSDPGTRNEYQTLEITWVEHDVEMRLSLYFRSDGSDWWASEVRTYDGREDGEWVMFPTERFRRPLGTPFTGDVDITSDERDDGTTARVRITDLHLEPFRPPAACVNPTAPFALEVGTNTVTIRNQPNTGYALEATLLDTATCAPAPDSGITYVWAMTDPAIAAAKPAGARVDVDPKAPGRTRLRGSARRPDGTVVAETDVDVTVTT